MKLSLNKISKFISSFLRSWRTILQYVCRFRKRMEVEMFKFNKVDVEINEQSVEEVITLLYSKIQEIIEKQADMSGIYYKVENNPVIGTEAAVLILRRSHVIWHYSFFLRYSEEE